jgi:carbamoyl-phosphate synthase large subunit
VRLPKDGRAFVSIRDSDKLAAVQVARDLVALGFALVCTRGTAAVFKSHGIPLTEVNRASEGRPHIVDMIKNGEIAFIVNTEEATRAALADSRSIRTTALAQRVTYYTTVAGAKAACAGMKHIARLEPYRLQDLHARLRQATPEPVPS